MNIIDNMVENNKNKLDLTPGIDFVLKYIEEYEKAVKRLMQIKPDEQALTWANGIGFIGTNDIIGPQVMPEEARQILARMPITLIELSMLESISYHTYSKEKVIPIPGYDEMGNFDQSKVELVSYDEFPRPGDHPSRILVGVSDGSTIYPTPIPKTVHSDERSVYLYQIHVFLHEFFHTIDYKRRDAKVRSAIKLIYNNRTFTYQDWWEEWENLILCGKEPVCVSSYANTYFDKLNRQTFNDNRAQFTDALAEQICESFVAYMLNIISNDDDWTDFKSESFGNHQQEQLYLLGRSASANKKWLLIDKLCNSLYVKEVK